MPSTVLQMIQHSRLWNGTLLKSSSSNSRQYMIVKTIGMTLQGYIYKAIQLKNDNNSNEVQFVVIKQALKQLACENNSIDGIIDENIKQEIKVQEHLTNKLKCVEDNKNKKHCNHFCMFIDSFEDVRNIYLVMECLKGQDLFGYVSNHHPLLVNDCENCTDHKCKHENKEGDVDVTLATAKQWLGKMQTLFSNLVYQLNWMHNSANVCHCDISPENIMFGDENNDPDSVKFIDFGLAKLFTTTTKTKTTESSVSNKKMSKQTNLNVIMNKNDNNNDNKNNNNNNASFLAYGCVGKSKYMSIEVWQEKECYDARKADIWSLGVCLFDAVFGVPLYKNCNLTDSRSEWLKYLLNGEKNLREIIQNSSKLDSVFANEELMNLFDRIFKYEKDRISMEQLLKHPFVANKLCLNNDIIPSQKDLSFESNNNNNKNNIVNKFKSIGIVSPLFSATNTPRIMINGENDNNDYFNSSCKDNQDGMEQRSNSVSKSVCSTRSTSISTQRSSTSTSTSTTSVEISNFQSSQTNGYGITYTSNKDNQNSNDYECSNDVDHDLYNFEEPPKKRRRVMK